MGIFAISDLHLGFSCDKPMDIFGENWRNHADIIQSEWMRIITEGDTILVPGDISWAINMQEAATDLQFLNDLPGKKIIVEGNHDQYWWQSTKKLNEAYDNLLFLRNTHVICEGFAICGTRGWNCPGYTDFTDHDEKIYKREVNRLKMSLDSAIKAGVSQIIAMIHYPPSINEMESGFTELIHLYPVKMVVYGHLHGQHFDASIKGMVNGVEYILASADYLNFCPVRIV